jgi:hypothetical protein
MTNSHKYTTSSTAVKPFLPALGETDKKCLPVAKQGWYQVCENSPFYKGIFAVRILKVGYHLESNAEAFVRRETYDCIRRGYTPEVLREIKGRMKGTLLKTYTFHY